MLLSVIMPSYNQGFFIEKSILSVLNQNYKNYEFIIIDGGSTDETLSILYKYSQRIKFISEKDDGQASAINKGISMSTGEIICWLNSDDLYERETLSCVANFFIENNDVDIMYGKAIHIDSCDKFINEYQTSEYNLENLKNHCILCQPATFFRKRLIKKIGLIDHTLDYCMDYEYWLRAAKNNIKFFYMDKFFAKSRLHSNNKTLSQIIKVHYEIIKMFETRFGMVPYRWISNYVYVTRGKYNFNIANLNKVILLTRIAFTKLLITLRIF